MSLSRRSILGLSAAGAAISLTPARGESFDQPLARHLEHEMPGFWAYFSQRHPEFGKNAPDCLWGRMDIKAIYEAQAETITAYVKEFGRPA